MLPTETAHVSDRGRCRVILTSATTLMFDWDPDLAAWTCTHEHDTLRLDFRSALVPAVVQWQYKGRWVDCKEMVAAYVCWQAPGGVRPLPEPQGAKT